MCAATGSMLAISSASVVSANSSVVMARSPGLLQAWESVLRDSERRREEERSDVICVADVKRSLYRVLHLVRGAQSTNARCINLPDH
jgi:hypothetical protein